MFRKVKFEYKFIVIYLILGGLWILFSDMLLSSFTKDVEVITQLQTYKGWFYVVVSAVFFYVILRNHMLHLRSIRSDLSKINDELIKSEEKTKIMNDKLKETTEALLKSNQESTDAFKKASQKESELEKLKENIEGIIQKRTIDLKAKNAELESFNQLFINREFRIKELKDQIKELKQKRDN